MPENGKPYILIVDDNARNVQFLASLLSENGYELAVAMTGKLALDFVVKNEPDLILLDIMMPKMDGYEVCTRIKKMSRVKDVPVIFLTAKSETEDLVRGFEVGGVDYITKPFSTPELLARIKTHIDLKLARDEIKTLRGIIPICAECKKIRDDKGYWENVETYIQSHSKAQFSHGLCPDCIESLYGDSDWFPKYQERMKDKS